MDYGITVDELVFGDGITQWHKHDEIAWVIAVGDHPRYKGLKLVVWWLESEKRFSFDALSPVQEVGRWAERSPNKLIDILDDLGKR